MLAGMDLSMVNWARAQFALTAMYHWLFVPLTLGMTWLIAFFHTIYVKTGDEENVIWSREPEEKNFQFYCHSQKKKMLSILLNG